MEDLHDRWSHRRLTDKAICKKSLIDGIGIFATEDIRKDEIIMIVGGIVVPASEIKKYWDKVGYFGTRVTEDFYIVPSTREEIEKGGAFNHSCEPNVGWSGDVVAVAIRDIEQGEELTMDYGMYDIEIPEFECNCGSPNCRKVIKSEDWKLPKLKEKYFDYFAPYLKKKILKEIR